MFNVFAPFICIFCRWTTGCVDFLFHKLHGNVIFVMQEGRKNRQKYSI